ncbi:MAG: hypothetical protein JWQ19_2122 [Subtercola sp.]|nr:hypothetical protein [Subtercola sp.]
MENHSTSDIDIETTETPKKGLTRRQVATGAAWAVPVVALAVAAPAAAASTVLSSPTAYVTGTLSAGGTGTHRVADYTGGNTTYNSLGFPGLNSGNLTLTISWTNPTKYTITYDAAGYLSAGWQLLTNTPASGLIVYTHTPVNNGGTILMPAIHWTSSVKPNISIDISSDSDDVSGLGLSVN